MNTELDFLFTGHNIFDERGWLKYHPKMVIATSPNAGILFSIIYNVENYNMKKYLKRLKSNNFFFVLTNRYIAKKLNLSPFQIRNSLSILEKNGFIVIGKPDKNNNRLIKIDWEKTIKTLNNWYKKEIEEEEEEKKNESDIEEMNNED